MSSWAPVATTHSQQWHHEKFLEFVTYKQLIGEPSPHMTLAGYLSKDEPVLERVWRAGVYGAPYSVLTSEAIWHHWRWLDAQEDPMAFHHWVFAHWAGFHVRTERRMVRTPHRMLACLRSWLTWCNRGEYDRLMAYQQAASPQEAYEAWYKSVGSVMYFGRYITIRVVEFLRRYASAKAEMTDIRSVGAESPVRCLSLLYPGEATALLVHKDAAMANLLAEELLAEVQSRLPQVGHYVLAAMLCEYREAYEDRHQYPGRTIDQELEYLLGPKGEYWKAHYDTQLWAARMATIPTVALGEHMGWTGVRHDLSRWLQDQGEVWTDTKRKYPSMEWRHGDV